MRLGGAGQLGVGEDALAAVPLGGGDGLDIEEFEHRRIHAEREQVDGGFQRGFVVTESQQEGPTGGRQDGEFERGLRDHAERAFGANPEVTKIEAADELAERGGPADLLAGGQKAFERVDVIADHAVFRGAQAAGVGGDVAADATVLHRGRVGWEKESVRSGKIVDVGRDRAGLDGRHR